jgi:hypothetical protein
VGWGLQAKIDDLLQFLFESKLPLLLTDQKSCTLQGSLFNNKFEVLVFRWLVFVVRTIQSQQCSQVVFSNRKGQSEG